MKDILPWIMSCVTIASIWLAGSKWRYTWLLTLGNQVLWATWIFSIQAWGLLPMTIAIVFVATRNHFKWAASGEGNGK